MVHGFHGAVTRRQSPQEKQFYGVVSLDPVRAEIDFATVIDEVVQHFIEKLGVQVAISVGIIAKRSDVLDEPLQRAVKENCSVLRFSTAEFEE
jgi:hypothetical protein